MRTRIAAAVVVAAVVAGSGYAFADAGTGVTPLGPGLVTVELDIEHSRFSLDELHVRAGTTVRFVVDNRDPIAHELVVGGDDVHARHRTGGEALHPPVPGEVSVDANDTGVTFYEFDETGTFDFVCHLPNHAEYGMVGKVMVTR